MPGQTPQHRLPGSAQSASTGGSGALCVGAMGRALRTPPCANAHWGSVAVSTISSECSSFAASATSLHVGCLPSPCGSQVTLSADTVCDASALGVCTPLQSWTKETRSHESCCRSRFSSGPVSPGVSSDACHVQMLSRRLRLVPTHQLGLQIKAHQLACYALPSTTVSLQLPPWIASRVCCFLAWL